VLEKIPAILGKKVTDSLTIPIIGIGAGKYVDGQVLVMHDLLGISKDFAPRFLRRYLDLYSQITNATNAYVSDVKSRKFPSDKEQY
jgi:3-methyl-2-oxobutanoate hydroxymethyltransferase